jgi:hypothetical protein
MTVIMYAIICGPQALSVAFIPMAMMMTMAGSLPTLPAVDLIRRSQTFARNFGLFSSLQPPNADVVAAVAIVVVGASCRLETHFRRHQVVQYR